MSARTHSTQTTFLVVVSTCTMPTLSCATVPYTALTSMALLHVYPAHMPVTQSSLIVHAPTTLKIPWSWRQDWATPAITQQMYSTDCLIAAMRMLVVVGPPWGAGSGMPVALVDPPHRVTRC